MEQPEQREPQPRMEILQSIRKNFAYLGITQNLSTQAYPLNGKVSLGFLILGSHFVGHVMHTVLEAKTFSEYTQSTYMSSLALLIFFFFSITISNVKELFDLMNGIENLYNESCFVLWAIYIYFIHFTTGLGNAVFKLQTPIWFPFDWTNPIGFLIANSVQYTMFWYVMKIAAIVLALAIASFLYAVTMSRYLKEVVISVSRSAEIKAERKHIRIQLIEFMQFDSSAKQLISNFSGIFSQFITILFVWSLVTICAALLMIQMQILNRVVGDNLMVTTFQVVYAFSAMFIGSELGQRVNLAYVECDEMFDQLKWYLFPVEIQRMLPTIIHFVQQPVGIQCFGSAACDRETFKYVIKTAYSYFAVLRTFFD